MQEQTFNPNPTFQNRAYTADMARRLTRQRPKQGAYLAELRKKAGLSQAELAELINETQQNVAFWELCDKPPRSDVLLKMAGVLGVKVEDILKGKAVPERKGGPVGKVKKIFDEVSKLPRKQQDKIVEFVSAFVKQQGGMQDSA